MPDEENGQDQLPKPNNGKSSDNQKPTGAADKSKKKCRISAYQFRVATLIFDGLLVFVGAVYSFFAYQQWQSMTAQIRLANKTLHLDQRAWVAQDSLGGKAESGKPFTIMVMVKNTGKSFAKRFIGINGWSSKQISDPDPDFNALLTQATVNASVGLLPPNGGISQTLTIPEDGRKMTDDDIQNFNNPTKVFLFYGKLTYFDIFNCPHWTTFCYRAFPVSGQYNLYEAYNDADENECP